MAETAAEMIAQGKDITMHLTDIEKQALKNYETIIKKGLNTFLEVGQALAEIRDRRLYRETHKTFERYCKDVWDLSKSNAYYQIAGYETVHLLENKMSTIVDKNDPEQNACASCEHRKAMANRAFKGVRIPEGYGKCTRPEGLCEKITAPAADPGRNMILPINEAQTRPLTKLKNPDDQVKAWGLVLEKMNETPNAKLTAALINKAVKQVRGEAVKRQVAATKTKVEQTSLVSNQFKHQYQVMLDIVTDSRNSGWTDCKQKEVVKYLEALVKVAKSDD